MPPNADRRFPFGRGPYSADTQNSGQQGSTTRGGAGFFANAGEFMIHGPNMIDLTLNEPSVFNILKPVIIPEAVLYSSARDPPPRCLPGTRVQLHKRLESWLVDHDRLQSMIWLRGPAGTGKSAVAQTFAEHADDQGRLGAAFFFSRANGWDKPLRVIPTLAYQLALKDREYSALLTEQLVRNHLVLKAALHVQFRKLIFEPFSVLGQNSGAARKPLLIVLDGLDECKGEDAQHDLIKRIGEVAGPENKLPLLWLVCSRPEPVITFAFSATESP